MPDLVSVSRLRAMHTCRGWGCDIRRVIIDVQHPRKKETLSQPVNSYSPTVSSLMDRSGS